MQYLLLQVPNLLLLRFQGIEVLSSVRQRLLLRAMAIERRNGAERANETNSG